MAQGVEFDEDKTLYGIPRPNAGGGFGVQTGTPFAAKGEPAMVQWLIKKGWAKTPAAAQSILIVLIILNAIITYVVLKYFV